MTRDFLPPQKSLSLSHNSRSNDPIPPQKCLPSKVITSLMTHLPTAREVKGFKGHTFHMAQCRFHFDQNRISRGKTIHSIETNSNQKEFFHSVPPVTSAASEEHLLPLLSIERTKIEFGRRNNLH